jgi:hypothetical protein
MKIENSSPLIKGGRGAVQSSIFNNQSSIEKGGPFSEAGLR